MYRYLVTGRWQNIHSDFVIGLNDQQAERLKDKLEPKGKGIYLVKDPIQIPKGESFGYQGEIIPVNCERQGDWTGNEKAVPSPAASNEPPAGGDGNQGNSNLNPPAGGNNENTEELDTMHWTKIKELVLEKGGEFVNKAQGIAFLKSLNNAG